MSRKHRASAKRNLRLAHKVAWSRPRNANQMKASKRNLRKAQASAWVSPRHSRAAKRNLRLANIGLARAEDKPTGHCEICGHLAFLRKDHDHYTRKKRGKICNVCNLMLGILHDSIERLERTIAYLRKYGTIRFPRLKDAA